MGSTELPDPCGCFINEKKNQTNTSNKHLSNSVIVEVEVGIWIVEQEDM